MEFGTPSLLASACIMSMLVQLSSFIKQWAFDEHLRIEMGNNSYEANNPMN